MGFGKTVLCPLTQHLFQRMPSGRGDVIAQDAPLTIACDPAVKRHRLRDTAVHHGSPCLRAIRTTADDNGLVHLGRDRQQRTGFAQAPQNALRLAAQSFIIGHHGV